MAGNALSRSSEVAQGTIRGRHDVRVMVQGNMTVDAAPHSDRMDINADHTDALSRRPYTQRRLEILERLGEVSWELAQVYEAALWLVDDHSIPARGRLLAHCGRELMIRLPDHMDVPIEPHRVEWKQALDCIAVLWEDETHRQNAPGHLASEIADASSLAPSAEIRLSNDLHARIDRLLKDHLRARATITERVTGVLQPPGQAGTPFPQAQLETFVREWKKLNAWFAGHAHVPNPDKKPLDFSECQRRFEILENILYTRLCPFYGAVEELDDILEETNRPTS